MHILFVASWYPSEQNPFNGNFVKRHAELLAKKHQLYVLHFELSDSFSKVHLLKKSEQPFTEYVLQIPKRNKWSQYFHFRKALKLFSSEVKQVDCIHLNVMLEKGLFALWLQKKYQKPLFITEHASYLIRQNFEKLSKFQKYTIRALLRKASKISCVSPFLKNEIELLFPETKPLLTSNFIDTTLFIPSTQKENYFIHISTLEKVKNTDKIIEAFEQFCSKNDTHKLIIIREKENFSIETQINNSLFKDRIELLGPVQPAAIASYLQKAEALVHLSHYETFSCVLAESWACGVPVISTRVGIAIDAPDTSGIYLNEANPAELSKSMHQILEKGDRFDKETIRNHSIQFDAEHVSSQFDILYSL